MAYNNKIKKCAKFSFLAKIFIQEGLKIDSNRHRLNGKFREIKSFYKGVNINVQIKCKSNG